MSSLSLVFLVAGCGTSPVALEGESVTDEGPVIMKRVFITSTSYSGNLKSAGAMEDGLAGGDALCLKVAQAAGLSGSFKAWLSSDSVDAIDRIIDVGPWFQFDASQSPLKTFANKEGAQKRSPRAASF